MKPLSAAATCLLALAALSGCASSDLGARRSYVSEDEVIQRPGRIIVHNIAATPGDIAGDSATAGRYEKRPPRRSRSAASWASGWRQSW